MCDTNKKSSEVDREAEMGHNSSLCGYYCLLCCVHACVYVCVCVCVRACPALWRFQVCVPLVCVPFSVCVRACPALWRFQVCVPLVCHLGLSLTIIQSF